MSVVHYCFDNWDILCIPEDGCRIASLKYLGFELFTTLDDHRGLPRGSYGEYERRPVYGYDDCFPSVVAGMHPAEGYHIRDHGQVCWIPWHMIRQDNSLHAWVDCDQPRCRFGRTIEFRGNELIWSFLIENHSAYPMAFLHVPHPLFRIRQVASIILPDFNRVQGIDGREMTGAKSPMALNAYLMSLPEGRFDLLNVLQLKEGVAGLRFRNERTLYISFDIKLFPNLAIWWNNNGYPQEVDYSRCECALEPISGSNSDLAQCYAEGNFLRLAGGEKMSWEMRWRME